MRRSVLAVILTTALLCCGPQREKSGLFSHGRSLGKNKNEKLEEASGLAASASNAGFLWTHNDSGKPDLFLLDTAAETKKVFRLSGVKNRDWEDIALGPGPEAGINYVYIGDIGDNYAQYPFKFIYRVREPTLDQPDQIADFDKLIVRLSDESRDAETLLSDPLTGRLYIVSKRDRPAGLYEIAEPNKGDTLVANRVADLSIRFAVGGDISPNGSEVLIKNYEHVYYWKRNGSESLAELLVRKPVVLPYEREAQGEAITWARDGSGYYTLGENAKGERAKLFFYKRNNLKAKN